MSDPNFSYADPSMPAMKRGLIRVLEAATGQRRLKQIYLARRPEIARGRPVFTAALEGLALDVHHDRDALARIPATGPLVVVANHPYGVLDGIAISWLVGQVRSDFAVLTHAALTHLPEVKPHLLPVDFSATPEAAKTNLRSRAEAHRLLAAGGCVVVFPAGGISTAPDRLGRHPAVDAPWQPFTAQLIQRSRATVVPIRFDGQNSRLFQIASHINPALRLSLIFHEVHRRIGTSLTVAIGRPIRYGELPNAEAGRQHVMRFLRETTEALAFPQVPVTHLGAGRRKIRLPFARAKIKSPLAGKALKLRFPKRQRDAARASAPPAIGRDALIG